MARSRRHTDMRLLRLVLLSVLVSAGVLVTGGAGPAFACYCVQHLSDSVAAADEIFTGTLVGIEDPPRRAVVSSGDPITYTVAVDAVYQGDVGATAEFQSARFGASCGLENMVVDRRYVVFVNTDGPRRWASLCGGTAPATAARLSSVERLTGPPAGPAVTVDEPSERSTVAADDAGPAAALSAWAGGVAGFFGVGAALVGAGLSALLRDSRHE